jgi:phosphopantothenoylcysteine decarboxylase
VWIDMPGLHDATGHPVRTGLRAPDEPEFVPRGDAVLVAPATFNTINKCAAGVNDSLALGLINEAVGTPSVPLALVPWVNSSLSSHPADNSGLGRLEGSGARTIMPNVDLIEAFDNACSSASQWLAATVGHAVPPAH